MNPVYAEGLDLMTVFSELVYTLYERYKNTRKQAMTRKYMYYNKTNQAQIIETKTVIKNQFI